MNDETLKLLKKFYDKLLSTIELHRKKEIEYSVLIESINMRNNIFSGILRDSSLTGYPASKEVLNDLLNKGWIRSADKVNEYFITAKGIWEVEKKDKIFDETKLLEYLDNKFFNISTERDLSDKEKVILFLMFSLRSFSRETAINLRGTDDEMLNRYKEVIELVNGKLHSLGVISRLTQEDLYSNPNERPVSNLFRRMNDLPKKTKSLYTPEGNQEYYLDISKENKISTDKLKFIFGLIFKGKDLSASELHEVYDFSCSVAHEKGVFLIPVEKYIFSRPEFDDLLWKVLFS